MSRFPAGGRPASRAGRTPLDRQSGARSGQRRRKRGSKYIPAVPGETAVAAGRTGTREGARHRKISRKRGKAKACAAAGNTQMKVFHALLPRPAPATRTSAPTTTNASATATAASPASSASSAASATRSPSSPSTPGPES
jgi:hypothetical protein